MRQDPETYSEPVALPDTINRASLVDTDKVVSTKGTVHWRNALLKIGIFVVSLFLFILAITLMKEGARSLAPYVRDSFRVTNPMRALGFGWLFAYVIMSGSPVAAASLTFLDAGVITPLSAFTMITGSRFGANFIVIFLGFVYVLRGRNRAASLSMGLLSFTVTFTTYLLALLIGLLLLHFGVFDHLNVNQGMLLQSVFDRIFDPIAGWIAAHTPAWFTFLSGLGIIILSFNLFDRCLPEMSLKESRFGQVSRVIYTPWVMFFLGGAVTLISMSVSVSLGILVPLSHRGLIRRENVIPYIMGANITTFVDTLLASLLLDTSSGFVVVLTEMVSVAIVSLIVLATVYRSYERTMLSFVNWCTASSRNLALFTGALFVVPLLLLLL